MKYFEVTLQKTSECSIYVPAEDDSKETAKKNALKKAPYLDGFWEEDDVCVVDVTESDYLGKPHPLLKGAN